MKFIYSSILVIITTFMIGSCTPVTSKNRPGTNEASFPKSMIGTYELYYPETFNPDGKSAGTVTISEKELTINTDDNKSVTKLGDSLFLSKIGKTYYLCMGEAPEYNVMKVVPGKKELKFYTLSCQIFVAKEDLDKYFKDVEEVKTVEEGEDGETSESITYSVTIDDAKLEDYFNSALPLEDPFILKKAKK